MAGPSRRSGEWQRAARLPCTMPQWPVQEQGREIGSVLHVWRVLCVEGASAGRQLDCALHVWRVLCLEGASVRGWRVCTWRVRVCVEGAEGTSVRGVRVWRAAARLDGVSASVCGGRVCTWRVAARLRGGLAARSCERGTLAMAGCKRGTLAMTGSKQGSLSKATSRSHSRAARRDHSPRRQAGITLQGVKQGSHSKAASTSHSKAASIFLSVDMRPLLPLLLPACRWLHPGNPAAPA